MKLLIALVVLASAPALEDDAEYRKAVEALKALEYEQAIFRLQEIVARPGLDPAARGEALFLLARSYAGTGNFDAARDAFKSALTKNPHLTLPDQASPRVTSLVAQVRRELMQAARDPGEAPPVEAGETTPAEVAAAPQAPPPTDFPVLLVSGAGVAVAGVAALVAAGVLGALAYSEIEYIREPGRFQEDAKPAQDRANLELWGAGGLGTLGAALVIGGGALAVVGALEE
jgi:tetratricopeptide (TPR) repeat protein